MARKTFVLLFLLSMSSAVGQLAGVEKVLVNEAPGAFFSEETYEAVFHFLVWFPGTVAKMFGQEKVPQHFCNMMGILEYAARTNSITPSVVAYLRPTILGDVPDAAKVWENGPVASVLANSKRISEEKFLYKYTAFLKTDMGRAQSHKVVERCGVVLRKQITAGVI